MIRRKTKLEGYMEVQGNTMSSSGQVNSMMGTRTAGQQSAPDPLRSATLRGETRATVIVNADDWGRDITTTDRTLDCVLQGTISSTSAMVFMEDSERAADLARQYGISTGLHLNFTMPLTARNCSRRLREDQELIGRFLRSHKLAKMFFHRRLIPDHESFIIRGKGN